MHIYLKRIWAYVCVFICKWVCSFQRVLLLTKLHCRHFYLLHFYIVVFLMSLYIRYVYLWHHNVIFIFLLLQCGSFYLIMLLQCGSFYLSCCYSVVTFICCVITVWLFLIFYAITVWLFLIFYVVTVWLLLFVLLLQCGSFYLSCCYSVVTFICKVVEIYSDSESWHLRMNEHKHAYIHAQHTYTGSKGNKSGSWLLSTNSIKRTEHKSLLPNRGSPQSSWHLKLVVFTKWKKKDIKCAYGASRQKLVASQLPNYNVERQIIVPWQ
jgi:hypothetical protein